MRTLWLAPLAIGASCTQPPPPQSPADCFTELATALSADDMGGRGIGTPGLEKAAALLEQRFEQAGLGKVDGGHRQTFEVDTGVLLGDGNALSFGDATLVVGEDFTPLGFSDSGDFSGEAVFVGYGIRAEELGYDDYAGVDVKGRVAVALRYEPGEEMDDSPFDGRRPTRWSDLRHKAMLAREAGASALVLVSPARADDEPDKLPAIKVTGPISDAGIPVVQVTRAVAERLLGRAVSALRDGIDADYQPKSFAAEQVVEGAVRLDRTRAPVSNVLGVVHGAGKLADEVVVVGAHYDHLGMGGPRSMKPDVEEIHNGADDNASGVAAMVCGAELLARDLPSDHRTLLVAAFTAEEIGLGGSAYYVRHAALPIGDTVAMVNLDMVGRVADGKLLALGGDTSSVWKHWLDNAGAASGLTVAANGDGYGPSDHASFYGAGVPVVHLFSGEHAQYHTPEDDASLLDMEGGGKVATLVASLLRTALTAPERPDLAPATAGPVLAGDSRGYGSYLGTIPDYTAMGATEGGVLLSGVREGGPAQRAGIQGGDRLVAMGGRTIENLYDMTFVLQDQRPGDVIDVTVLRGEERVTLQATLGTRGAAAETGGHGGTKPKHGDFGPSPHGPQPDTLAPGEAWRPTAGKAVPELLDEREVHFADLRQLTFGGENAEAYFSPDGRKLMFQWTPGEGTCDQQYVYDLSTGQVELVSSGDGRTTCGYFSYPDGERLIYATTEGGGAQCPPSPDHSMGYVWPLYDTFDLVWQDGPDGKPTPFLAGPGYDAEATACFQDGRLVFTSTRDGDLELYTVNADGSDLKRLTHTEGYDGGAFFTPDCSEIVWRASRPEGEKLDDYKRLLAEGLVRPSALEIFLMNADGSNVRQLTHNGAANFGPYPLPDASAFIYSSNQGGDVREFDLWLVPREGGESERVTFAEQFDGFPMFSPDGEWFVFASNRGGQNRETNLFIARWVP